MFMSIYYHYIPTTSIGFYIFFLIFFFSLFLDKYFVLSI